MSKPGLLDPQLTRLTRHYRQPLGRILCNTGRLSAEDLLQALETHRRTGAPLGRVCLAAGLVDEAGLREALALQWGAERIEAVGSRPDPALSALLTPEFCLQHGVFPWARSGGATVIATSRPEAFEALMRRLPDRLKPVRMAVAAESEIEDAIAAAHGAALAEAAEASVPAAESCRGWGAPHGPRRLGLIAAGAAAIVAVLLVPGLFFAALFLWAALTLLAATGMKALAFALHPPRRAEAETPPVLPETVPCITVLAPLFDESDIAHTLLRRLERLRYPRAALDVILVLEQADDKTRAALEDARLPPWMRVVEVPERSLRTKPRAMNYALRFARGEIVGIYDAEDAPDPWQLHRVAARFAEAPPDLACLQGVLDYYNTSSSWLSRCFTIEYATWFRIVLPGLARLGFAIPLGGTTLFIRRDALERLGAWDAHNVTEDCDLGFRLARHGWRTEMLASTTHEEATHRIWPWVRQRSRWLKGFMLTYLVHMRRPLRLLKQLGARRFLGFQLLLGTAATQFLLAPVLWSLWMVPFGLPHPLEPVIGRTSLLWMGAAFLASEAVALAIGFAAVARTRHRRLGRWVPTMHLYFPLGALAAYKALYELAGKPFFWDKTAHGHSLRSARARRKDQVPRSAAAESSFSRVTKATEM
ncbi:MAG: glycosyltransferase family 2 protein [Paracoccaceae bacterium]